MIRLILTLFIFSMSNPVLSNDLKLSSDAIKFTEKWMPLMADSIRSCDLESIEEINKKVDEFIKSNWDEERQSYLSSCGLMVNSIKNYSRRAIRGDKKYSKPKVGYIFPSAYESCNKEVDRNYKTKGSVGNNTWHLKFGPEPDPRGCDSTIDKSIIGNWVLPKAGDNGFFSRWTADLDDYREKLELYGDGKCEVLSWKGVEPKEEDTYDVCTWERSKDVIYINISKNGLFKTKWYKIIEINYRELVLKSSIGFGTYYLE